MLGVFQEEPGVEKCGWKVYNIAEQGTMESACTIVHAAALFTSLKDKSQATSVVLLVHSW